MFLSIDLGATNTRVASSSENFADILKFEKFPTHKKIEDQLDLIKNVSKVVSEGKKIDAVVLGLPGIIDKKKNLLKKFSNYAVLDNKQFAIFDQIFSEGTKVFIENDAALAGVCEAMIGAGKNFEKVAYITLSSGVGGSLILKDDVSFKIFSAEPGHQVIDETRGSYNGRLESFVSGRGFRDIYGVSTKDCYDERIWNDYASHLSSGIINVCSMWMPDVVVLGGGIINKFDSFYDALVANLQRHDFFDIPPILKSEFGDKSGVCGGFVFLKEAINKLG